MFGQLMDEGWFQKCCPEDNALYIALRYWSGTAKAGGAGLLEAMRIDNTVRSCLLALRQSGKISEARGQQLQTFYDDHRHQLQVDQANEAPDYIGGFMETMKIKSALIAQGEYLSKVFNAIYDHLVTDYPHIGAVELEATRRAFT